MKPHLYTNMTSEEWDNFREHLQQWVYSLARSDIGTDHPEGVRVLDEAFNELCAHVVTCG